MDRGAAALGLLGLVVGFVAARGVPRPAAGERDPGAIDAHAEAAGPLVLPEDCGGRRTALEAERQRLQEAIATAEVTRRGLEASRRRREGSPVPWTGAIDPLERPAAFEDAIRAGLDATELGDLVDLDCDEYPCVVSVLLAELLPVGAVSDATWRPLLDDLRSRGHDGRGVIAASSTTRPVPGGHRQVVSFVLGPDSVDAAVRTRARYRLGRAFQRATERLEQEAAE